MSADLLERAAAGELPEWACLKPKRRAHVERVATLMGEWACVLAPGEEKRWRAAGWLHDALRNANPDELRSTLAPEYAGWPAAVVHAPAAAARLRVEGVSDEALLTAITYHPLGSPRLDTIGRALYVADYIEPGRTFDPYGNAVLRARMPRALDQVVCEVAVARIRHALEEGKPLHPETVTFWNALAGP